MKNTAYSIVQFLLFFIFLILLSFSCNQQHPTDDQDFNNSEADTTQAFVVNWRGDTLRTGIPIEVEAVYHSGDSFPEPLLVDGDKIIAQGVVNVRIR